MEACYFAFVSNNFLLIAEAPDNVNAITGSLVAIASGTVKVKITDLITPEEVDQAVKKRWAGVFRVSEIIMTH